jgi:hypothetical protein
MRKLEVSLRFRKMGAWNNSSLNIIGAIRRRETVVVLNTESRMIRGGSGALPRLDLQVTQASFMEANWAQFFDDVPTLRSLQMARQ